MQPPKEEPKKEIMQQPKEEPKEEIDNVFIVKKEYRGEKLIVEVTHNLQKETRKALHGLKIPLIVIAISMLVLVTFLIVISLMLYMNIDAIQIWIANL